MLEADVEADRRDFTVGACVRVAAGERLALFGPSGAGKTTLLEVIAGLVTPSRGFVRLGGRLLTSTEKPVTAVPPWRRGVGLLRQDPGLFPHLSVRDNLRYARSAQGARPSAGGHREGELRELAGVLGIGGLLGAMPAKLSGGQAHRVALGRLLLSRCDALLLDEPYTGLDLSMRRTLTDLVISLVAERGLPSILVAHELAEAQAFASRLAVLDRGALLQIGAPGQVVRRPASRRVAELVGYTAFVPVPGGGQVAGIHPDRVVCGSYPDQGLVLAGTVTACRPAGALWEIDLRTGDVIVTGRLPAPATAGTEFVITATSPPVFGPGGEAREPRGQSERRGDSKPREARGDSKPREARS
ncbi:MAG TPA: ABC transporter ATP-binding protein [Streptosporangiaceae bacterium]|nr:ABC transporter ATP-binding protein [Streptosporangiaceae bacterium]